MSVGWQRDALDRYDGAMTQGREPFVHLHLHSHFSLLDATIRIPQLVAQVAEMDMPAVAVTDHGNLYGAYQFHRAARKAGLRPVVGCEVYVAPGDHRERKPVSGMRKPYHHLVLLAENETGWRNMVWLVSEGYLRGFYHRPRISKEILAERSQGLIGLSACLSGEVAAYLLDRNPSAARRVAEEYREILGPDGFFLEIQDHGTVDEEFVREGMRSISADTGIPLVATNDCHFHHRDDVFAHKVLIGIGQNKTVDELQRAYVYNSEYYVKSAAEMADLFREDPGACARTVEIAERCDFDFTTDAYHLPRCPVPEGHTLESYLEELSVGGLEARLSDGRSRRHTAAEYHERLASELDIIKEMGFPGYFLVVWDFMNYARKSGVPVGPGRGSAAGSVVSYALRITDIDPLEFDLLFERFLNPDRISMPDIDIDFCQRRREEVIEYVRRLYGEESVSQIATFNILKAKSAVRDVGRVMGLPFGQVDQIAKLIPDELNITLDRALEESPELKDLVHADGEVRQLVETAEKLEGLARHCGVHAAGVVIAPEPLTNLVPLNRTTHDEIATQFDKDDVEDLGLLKMDFLGLRTLTVISDALHSVELSGEQAPDLEKIPFDDPAVFDLFCRGDTDGIFQFESSGMKELLRKVHPRVFADLAALNALYRPGPMQFIDDFTARKHGRKPITYIFPELEEILGETYGIIVYQEQVMRIAVRIAGFSMAQADLLRKAMGKKKQEIIAREGETFIKGGVAAGFPEDKVRKLWEQIVPFAMYGFNKSHSVAYAHVAYLTAYLKVHYPAHFMAAMLTSEAANTDKLAMYLARSRHMGIEILPPDINASLNMFTVEPGGIRFGLVAVKGVGGAAVEAILHARQDQGGFTGVTHFLQSLPARAANHKVIECLAKAGCFDQFGLSRGALLNNLDQLMEAAASEREQRELGQSLLFEELGADSYENGLRGGPEVDAVTRLAWEREVLGFYLSGHPLDRYRPQLRRFSDCEIGQLAERANGDGPTVAVGGLIAGMRVNQIRKEGPNQGRRLASFQLEDPTGSVRVVAFPDTFEKYRAVLENDTPVLVVATVRGEDEHPELIAESISPLGEIDGERAEGIRIELNLEEVEETRLEELLEFLLEHSGPLPVRFELLRPGRFRATLAPPAALTVRLDEEFLQQLEGRVGSGRAQLVFPARSQAVH